MVENVESDVQWMDFTLGMQQGSVFQVLLRFSFFLFPSFYQMCKMFQGGIVLGSSTVLFPCLLAYSNIDSQLIHRKKNLPLISINFLRRAIEVFV